SPSTASIRVTENTTGLFTFGSVDLSSNTAPNSAYLIQGFLSNIPVLTETGTIPVTNTFVTVASVNPSQVLDRLSIHITPAPHTTSANVDNINVSPAVPEPGSLVLLGIGALGLLGYGYRRRQLAAA